MKYFVTALGCGIAGYKVSEIAQRHTSQCDLS